MDARNNTAVFTLTSCVYDEEYCSTVAAFFRRVDSFGIENVIVDLRGNTGGNSWWPTNFSAIWTWTSTAPGTARCGTAGI